MGTKLVRKASQKGGMPKGVRYRTFDKAGNSTNYASAKDAAGYNDTTQGRADMSQGKALFKADANGKVITPQSLTNTGVANVPTVPTTPNVGDLAGSGNVALATMLSGTGYTQDSNGLFVAPKADAGTSADQSGYMNAFQNYLGATQANQPVSNEDIYNKTLKESGVNQAQKDVNNYTAQLNSIVAKSQAEQLGLEGQGRGVTESIIGGQQAQINREAAIQALPVQAQLSAAQGNLEFAQKQLDTLFSIRSADAKAKYDFNNSLISSVYNFATTIEQSRLNGLKAKEDRAYSETQQSIADAKNYANMALEYGNSSLFTKLTNLDPKSATFATDVKALASQIRKPAPAGDGAPKVVSINGVDSVWNAQTGQFEAVTVGGASTLKPVKDAEIKDLSETWTAKNSVMSLVDSLQNNIRKSGTQNLFGKTSGQRTGDTTNLLLAMKNLEKTGALDAGTIKVLEGTIPSSKFFATEAGQIAALQSIKDTINSKVSEYVGSYRGTSAETDPRTQRIYSNPSQSYKSAIQILLPDEQQLFDDTWNRL